MRIYDISETDLCFDISENASRWVRFTKLGSELKVDSHDGPPLNEASIKVLRKWLKKAFRKSFYISRV